MRAGEPFRPQDSDAAWRNERVLALYGTFPVATAATVLIAAVLAAAQWTAAGAESVLIWLAVLATVTLGRITLAFAYRRAGETDRPAPWVARYRVGALGSGLSWALGAWLLFTPGDAVHQLFLAFAIGASCAGASSALAVDRVSTLCFVTPPLATLVGLFVAGGTTLQFAMTVIIALYFGFVVLNGERARRWLRELTDLRSTSVDREQRLVANERLLDSIIENLPAMVFLKRASDLSFERLNRFGLSLLHVDAADLIGRTDHDLWPKEQADFFEAMDRKVLAQADVLEIPEEPIATAGGETRYLRTSKIALRDGEGRPTHLLGLSVDITLHRQAQEALRTLNAELETRIRERTAAAEASERFIRATMDALDARVAVLDEEGRIIATNAAWRAFGFEEGMTPFSIGEGDSYLAACDWLAAERHLPAARLIGAGVRDVIAGRRTDFALEHRSPLATDARWFLCRVSRFATDGPPWVVVTHDDVTEIHLAREQVEAGERMIASLDAVAPVGIFRLDANGRTRSVNQRYCEITGLTLEEIVDDGWRRAVHPEDLERVIGAWDNAVRARAPVHIEYRFLHRDGTVVWVIGQTVEVVDAAGAVTGYVGTLTDITERRALEAQLAQAVKMEAIGKLTGGIAHDFNNFLGIIMGNLDLLREHAEGDAVATRLIDAALRGATRSAGLTQSLLAFSRRQPLDPRLADVNERLSATFDLLRRSLRDTIALVPDLDPAPWPVRIDGAQFDSCILNLVNNARDAMPEGGTLRISTRNVRLDEAYAAANPDAAAGDHLLIEVADTGSGMAPELVGRVFEPFFTTKPTGHGTGLGLSMVYGFVKQSGGHIVLDSKPGRGTAVRIYLPRDRHAGVAAAPGARGAASPVPRGRERVLVVEDNEQMRQTATAQLTSLGYQVVEAENGEAALALLDGDGAFDLVFSDVVMPGEPDGFGLARLARERWPGIKVLLTSGFPGDALQREPGGSDPPLLGKPYRKEELARALRAVLDPPASGAGK